MTYKNLNPDKALIWRIVHRDNLPWILDHGLHCGNCHERSSHWVNIGNAELIDKRSNHCVPLAPFGTLNDYVPFYFTPFSVMLKNIHSGRGGVKKRENDEIIILVSSLYRIQQAGLPFLFTNSHAYYRWAEFFNDLKDLLNYATPEEQKITDYLTQKPDASIDIIAIDCGIAMSKLSALLLNMEFKGLITCLPGKCFHNN